MKWFSFLTTAMLAYVPCGGLASAYANEVDGPTGQAAVLSIARALGVSIRAVGQFDDGVAIHGVGGDRVLLFTVRPAPAPTRTEGLYVTHRVTGHMLGAVTPPPTGWHTPASIIVLPASDAGSLEDTEVADDGTNTGQGATTSGTFLLQALGSVPAEAGTVPPSIHKYSYNYSPNGGFSATWLETHTLPLFFPPEPGAPPPGIFYSAGFARLPDGSVAVNDSVLGAIWVAGPSLEGWQLIMIDPDFASGHCDDIHGVGRAFGGGTRTYDMRTPFNLCPGIHSMAYATVTDELCTLRSTPGGAIWCISRPTLLDLSIPPFAKGALKRTVVPNVPGVTDLGDGMDYDRFNPDSQWLYWARSVADAASGNVNTIYRVSLTTGEVQIVVQSNELLDWTSNIAVLPPRHAANYTTIIASVGQEENNPELNMLLVGVPAFVAPTPIPLIQVRR